MTAQAFWIPEGNDNFHATIHTQGPWDANFQHGGPPGALLVRQLEQCSPRPDMILGRISIDILGPVPIATLHASARLVRPGRSVELLEAALEHEGRTIMRASAWRIRVPTERPPAEEPDMPPPLPPQEATSIIAPEWDCGFLAATEWRYARGDYTQPGAATAWVRMRYPLIAEETVSPAQRLILSADSANGMSSPLDIRFWQFIPPELTIHCLRPPIGEWICVDANTLLQSEGIGLTSANLYDERGMVGRSAQALLIFQRIQKKEKP
jgi:hypothetical protein